MLNSAKPKGIDIQNCVKTFSETYSNFIFVTNKSITQNKTDQELIKKIINEFKDKNLRIQNFTVSELQFNIMRHELQPKQFPIKEDEEIKNVMASENIRHKTEF